MPSAASATSSGSKAPRMHTAPSRRKAAARTGVTGASCFTRPVYARRALPVRACLVPVAADLHRAPGSGQVLRPVVERPVAAVVAAGLEPPPGAVQHRGVRRRQDPAEGAVDAACPRLELQPPPVANAEGEAGPVPAAGPITLDGSAAPASPAFAISSRRSASRSSRARWASWPVTRARELISSCCVSQIRSPAASSIASWPDSRFVVLTSACTRRSGPGAGLRPPGR